MHKLNIHHYTLGLVSSTQTAGPNNVFLELIKSKLFKIVQF